MAADNNSIHDFDLDLICEYYSRFERQGPGSPEVTIKALSFIDNLNDESLIADVGCGSGGQTIPLLLHWSKTNGMKLSCILAIKSIMAMFSISE